MEVISFGLYQVQDRKFRRVKAARYKMIKDWHLENV
jgi:hypothetical protein